MPAVWGLRALILLACDANDAFWLPLDYLVSRVAAPVGLVQEVCDALVWTNQLEHAVVDNVPCYGVNVSVRSQVLAP